MTRMANGAQRSGAAMLSLVFTQPREDYVHASRLLSPIFFCVSPTPARWLLQGLWAQWSGGASPGSVVLHGTGGRTRKRLKSNGSEVLFWNLTRDAHADVRAYACLCVRTREGLKLRTSEPGHFIKEIEVVTGSELVLSRFCQNRSSGRRETFASKLNDLASAASIKITGGYGLRPIAAWNRCASGLNAGGARGNFQRQILGAAGLAASIEVAGELRATVGKNDGFLRFFEGARGRVGTPMLECSQETAENRASRRGLRQPAGLAARRLADQLAPRGADAAGEGGTPPTGPRLSLRPCAQPVFRVSADLETRRSMTDGVDRDSRLSSKPKMGSGVCDLPRASDDRREDALDWGQQQRVGVQGGGPELGRSWETTTLWGGLHRVN